MKHSKIPSIFVLLAAVAVTLSGCASGPGGRNNGSALGAGPVSAIVQTLPGTYRLQEGGADLRLEISTLGTGESLGSYNLLATASGTYQGRTVNEQGVLRLSTEGSDVMMSIVPHFGEPVTSVSPGVTEFSANELAAACTVYLRSSGNGWTGSTQGTGDCVRAVAGAVGQWQVQIQPGTLAFSSGPNAQPLVFRQSGGTASR